MTDAPPLRPFWSYLGGKWRNAPRYPAPRHDVIVEPFAGSAGYSLRYPERSVILVEKYRPVREAWRWLISASPSDVLDLPIVESSDDLPGDTPRGARALIGLNLGRAIVSPRRKKTPMVTRYQARCPTYAWSTEVRARVAAQVPRIKHWKIVCGDFTWAPDVEATWFVDPPYQGRAGAHYPLGADRLSAPRRVVPRAERAGDCVREHGRDVAPIPCVGYARTQRDREQGRSGRRSDLDPRH
jgi:hypothetical protein